MSNSASPDHSAALSALITDLVFEALRTNDVKLNAITIELFGRFGPTFVRSLVLVASNRKNKPGHRLRRSSSDPTHRPDRGAELFLRSDGVDSRSQ